MSDALGIYLHIPFCRSKCPYCDFFSGQATEAELDRYTAALKASIADWGQRVDRPITTVYLGGGTPSVLGTERLAALLTTLQQRFQVKNDAEITVEVNPESGKALDFARLREVGFNRVSVGLQSAAAHELKALGRIHRVEDARQTVKNAQAAGIENLSLDLMMGIPYQTVESLKTSIDFCVSCSVTHISSYLLKIEEETPFFENRRQLPLADEDEQAALYLFAVDYLEQLGYAQYEISNFARRGYESRHNSAYWQCAEYIGIGPSAHSFYGGKRFYYGRSLQDFYDGIMTEDGSGGDAEEFIMLSLRLKRGLVFAEYERRYQQPLPPRFFKKLEPYVKSGYMELFDDRLAFTPKGFLVSNTILSRLL